MENFEDEMSKPLVEPTQPKVNGKKKKSDKKKDSASDKK